MSGALVVNQKLEEAKKKLKETWTWSNINTPSLNISSEEIQKNELSNFVNKKKAEWMTQAEAVKSYAVLNSSLNQNPNIMQVEI